MNKGVVQIYYGKGHGKSTAAMGSAILTASQGKEVVLIQFMKGKAENEEEFLARLEPEIKCFRFAKSDEPYEELTEEEQKEECINLRNGFNYGKKAAAIGECDLLILDEILGLLDEKVVTLEEVTELVNAKPDEMNIIFTGRVLPEAMRDLADEIYNIESEK